MSEQGHSSTPAVPSGPRPIYGLEDRPELPKTLVLGAQHVLTMFGATVSVPLLFGPAMGMSSVEIARLISCVMLCSGLATLVQTTIGSRLPIVQGVSFSFLGAFFFIIGAGAFFSFSFCMIFLKEPEGAFADEYHLSSVDHAQIAEDAAAAGKPNLAPDRPVPLAAKAGAS